MKTGSFFALATAAAGFLGHAVAIEVDFTSPASVKTAASSIAFDLMSYYTGNQSGQYNIPGLLEQPPSGYFWWQAGAMWNTMLDYWHITGDNSYNEAISQALVFQVGNDRDYMPTNQTKALGNDDQGFWGMAAMTAAEYNFPNPPKDQPQWLALAQAVFYTQASRWDDAHCNGGLKWQIFRFNVGYDYKNAISNGCFFNLGSRLARYTGNDTYSNWAEKTWEWTQSIGLIDAQFNIYDGTDDLSNCTSINHVQYSYNAGVWILGAATMYNITKSDIWKARVQGLLDRSIKVFSDAATGIIIERDCELTEPASCNTDQKSFKAYITRWMAATSKVAPFTADTISKFLLTSAKAAAAQCTGGVKGRACGLRWVHNGQTGVWDGTTGVGEEMSALEVIQSTLIGQTPGPVTNTTGGTSQGNYKTGSNAKTAASLINDWTPTTGDKAGAGVVTAVILAGLVGGVGWMIMAD
ncbi:hydrolase 76 protein [Pseudogymnoascus destructans]|uniref:Mannan endo-1,6-alpha-mannosidase n=2 Tax=Pseudogymnoascus destructans TaxID=655981 RepID=L8FS24_PSED2|nr:hydrolase 76 protein [Pseudogymnoascus destructans]ELR03369.1 hypothetical protein GMDG_06112 [Pseudogymnoascus destructans 20631-21]OAF62127.1 hydrolase 76 protein [Pseudogymnoascus destructans]